MWCEHCAALGHRKYTQLNFEHIVHASINGHTVQACTCDLNHAPVHGHLTTVAERAIASLTVSNCRAVECACCPLDSIYMHNFDVNRGHYRGIAPNCRLRR